MTASIKSLFIKWFAFLTVYAYSFTLTRVIEIMTWNPINEINLNDAQPISDTMRSVLQDSYKRGKMLSEQDPEGFYLSLEEDQMQFFAPNNFTGYAISFANFEGLLSDQSNRGYSEVEALIPQIKLKKASIEAQDEYTLEVSGQSMGTTFRVISTSLLLESSRFDCSNKRTHVNRNLETIPEDIRKACVTAAQEAGLAETTVIEDLMGIYRTSGENRDVNLENCVEQFTLATYFSNDLLIKLNSGELLNEVIQILSSTAHSPTRFYSYMTQNEVFLGILTAIQKVAHAQIRNSQTISYNLYWGALQHNNIRLSLELYHNLTSGHQKIRVLISDFGGQLLFTMDIPLEKFIKEMTPFLVSDYAGFQKLCDAEASSDLDLKLLLLPKDYSKRFNNLTMQLTLLVMGICIVIIVLTMCLKNTKKKSKHHEEEHQGFNRYENELEDYSREESSPPSDVIEIKPEESYAV